MKITLDFGESPLLANKENGHFVLEGDISDEEMRSLFPNCAWKQLEDYSEVLQMKPTDYPKFNFNDLQTTVPLSELMQMIVKTQCEMTINMTPENIEIHLTPWKPFTYQCPYQRNDVEEVE